MYCSKETSQQIFSLDFSHQLIIFLLFYSFLRIFYRFVWEFWQLALNEKSKYFL